jgi:hypothetical protein
MHSEARKSKEKKEGYNKDEKIKNIRMIAFTMEVTGPLDMVVVSPPSVVRVLSGGTDK